MQVQWFGEVYYGALWNKDAFKKDCRPLLEYKVSCALLLVLGPLLESDLNSERKMLTEVPKLR